MIGRALLVVGIVALASEARAETAAWDGFQALGVPDAQRAALELIAADAVRHGGLVDSVVTDRRVSEKCAASIECHCEALRKRGLRYGAFGSLGHLGDLWTIELTLVDAHGCTVAGSTFASESLADDEVAARVAELATRLATPATTITETATGSERPIDATPAIVTTFTRAQLRALHIDTLDELLPFVPGYEIIDANWGGTIVNQGLQSTLLFLGNGVPMVNGLTNFRALGRDFSSSLAHVDRVEVVRGPGAVLWGQNAFLGVINLIPELPTRREAAVEAGVSASSLVTQQAWVRGAQNREHYAFVASVSAGRRFGATTYLPDSPQAVVGVAEIPFGNGGTTRPTADTWLDVVVRVALGKRVDLLVQNQTSDIDWEISPFGPLLDEGHGGYWKKTHRLYSLASSETLYDEPGAKLVGRARVSRYEFYSDENFVVQPVWPDGPAPATPDARDFRLGLRSLQGNDRPRAANQLDLRVVHDYTGAVTSQLTAGVGVLHQHTPASLATLAGVDEEPAMEVTSFGPRNFVTLSAFAIEELVPLPWLVVSGGARLALDRPYVESDPWRLTPSFQGGVAVKRGALGGKLIYAEGYRPPDAVQVFATIGTRGNPDLVPEYSRSLAGEVHHELPAGITVHAGGDVTRISDVIVLRPVIGDPVFANEPINKGRIDIASVFAGARFATPYGIDGFASYQLTTLDESDPTGRGIPIAHHTASFAGVWRPLSDLSVFARGAFASPRRLDVRRPDSQIESIRTSPTIRTTVGLTLFDVFAGTDLELAIDNPLLIEHDAPYRLDGSPNPLVERRRGTEAFATLRYDR
ncbi:MAG TPA: TonB-dependent receptor plug domain-containing protein [Kofleriaceae bacterium]|nr:TonB-dependent receptor plug domain-containing protein [Kofleriaceae bacterium]